jgi:tripartite-type tricarboxylate transporter receptor subunit TctC
MVSFRSLLAVAAALVLPLQGGAAHAQAGAFPSKMIRIIVPSTAGGPPDVIARMIAPKLSTALGQPVIVENRPGVGGMLGTAYVAREPADGYTMLVTTASHTTIPAFTSNATYDAVKDFTPVALLAQNFGQVLIVRPTLPVNTMQDLVALARKEPGKLTFGQAGLGTASHIPAEEMLEQAGINILNVPYKGVPEAMNDLLGGHIDMFFVGTQAALPLVKANQVRALAVTGNLRWKGMPDVPTMQESGFKGYNVVNWFGAWLPAGAPPAVVAKLHTEIGKALQAPDVQKEFDILGLRAGEMSTSEFGAFVAQQTASALAIAKRIEGRKK